jgi:DNA-binding winged helix-turn-helix (wHTH) protein
MRPESPRTYNIFIASPGDVDIERRKTITVVELLNDVWKNSKYPAQLECLSWEKSAHSSAGKPQEVIKRQIPFDTIDVFVAILWKKMGTPTETNRPKDNRPYLSGTQQEIEEAYEYWKHTGRPIIMLYRKDEPIPATMSKAERQQFNRLNSFLNKFQSGGEYPTLVKFFKTDEFEGLLRRELAQATSELVEVHREEAKIEKPKYPVARQQESPSEYTPKDTMDIWLKNVKLKENPFRHQAAEYDAFLPLYFTRFPDLDTITASDLTIERKPWVFFGKEGSGKTALRKFIAARGRPQNQDSDVVCIEYDQVKFEHLLDNAEDPSDFQKVFVRSIFNTLSEYTGNVIESFQPSTSLRGKLANLSVALRGHGINWVLCLIDPGKEVFDWKGTQATTSSLVEQILSFSDVGGYGFRCFLPISVKDELNSVLSHLPFNQYRVMEIKWDEKTLKKLLEKRMTQLSVDLTAPYRSLGELCDDEQNLSSLIDSEIANLARGNPRGAIWLANRLIELHCDMYLPPSRMTPETWNQVKMAWWANGESRILGISEYDTLRILSYRIFYRSYEIILLERSDRLLKCLIDAKGGFRSKEELIKAGWKDEKNLQGISEKALSEAMRRMKEELKKELKSKGFKDLDWIKSVRGRGYRLWRPNTSQEEQEGEND